MSKKVAIVSCYFQPNYGSQLQAYATQLIFDKLGVSNETINIDGFRNEINRAKYKYFLKHLLDINVIKEKFGFVNHKLAKHLKGEKYKSNLLLRDLKFKEFEEIQFNLSGRFNSKSELSTRAYEYSAFLVGSDQLWLPSNIEADYYTLNFVPEDVPKISYSTSFGFSNIEIAQRDKVKQFIKRINYLSVREQSGVEIIKRETGCNAVLVCDPTLLFNSAEWNEIAIQGRMYEDKYILVYFLGADKMHRYLVKKIKEKTDCKIVVLQHIDKYVKSDEEIADYAPYSVGPSEFIQLVRDAEYVVTDSFHATVFSLLFKKKFFTVRRFNKETKVSTNSRLYSLLTLLHLENRLIDASTSIDEILKNDINYDKVHIDILKFRSSSLGFIKNALNKIGISYDSNY